MATQLETPIAPEHLGQHEAEFQRKMGDLALLDTSLALMQDPNLPHLDYYHNDPRMKQPHKMIKSNVLVTVPEYVQPHHYEAMDGSNERAEVLQTMSGAIRSTLRKGVENGEHTDGIDWAAAAEQLLERAATKPEERSAKKPDPVLLSALACALFAEDRDVRISFLEETYDSGLAKSMHDACRATGLSIITNVEDNKVMFQHLRDLADSFHIQPVVAKKYIGLLKKDSGRVVSKQRRVLQAKLAHDYAEGTVNDEDIDLAEQASVHGRKVSERLLDAHKIERFALQAYFIGKQMEALFPDGDFSHSPLANLLVQRRQDFSGGIVTKKDVILASEAKEKLSDDKANHPYAPLQAAINLTYQARLAIEELSQPVIASFKVPDASDQAPALTAEQRANMRFKQLRQYHRQGKELVRFINFDRDTADLSDDSTYPNDIWSTSERGAGATDFAENIICAVVIEALRLQSEGDLPSAEELRDLVQNNRDLLLTAAGSHDTDLGQLSDKLFVESNRVRGVSSLSSGGFHLSRDENGKLRLQTDVPIGSLKDQLDEYVGARLGCPALRVTSESAKDLSAIEKALFGSKNFIDHLLAAIINEAYERGVFELNNYQTQG